MIYLKRFYFASEDQEFNFAMSIKRKCYDSFYPFKVLSPKGLHSLEFSPITIFYGGNGSGKTTALNIIASTLQCHRRTLFNQSNFWQDYIGFCDYEAGELPEERQMIASDDVFDYSLGIRHLNQGIDRKREELFDEYLDHKYATFKMKSLDDYEALKINNLAKRKTQSQYVRNRVMDNVRERSNGESGYFFFTETIKENGLYLLDEPENSLSVENQLKLMTFIEDSARFYKCQFIIATHSPFLLAMREANVYDFDACPVTIKDWTDLEMIQTYYQFFMANGHKFDK